MPRMKGFLLELHTDVWGQKTRMMMLPDGERSLVYNVLTQVLLSLV